MTHNRVGTLAAMAYGGAMGLRRPVWNVKPAQLTPYGRSYTRAVVTKRRTKVTAGSFKKAVYNTQPAKHLTGEDSESSTHNTILTIVPSQAIIQGTSNVTRIGDSAYFCAIKLKYNFQSNATAGAYSWRIIVGWTGEELTTAGIESGFQSGLGSSELFLPTTGSVWGVNGIINAKAFTVLHDATYDINSQVAAANDLVSDVVTIPLNTNFVYQSAASRQGKTKNLCIVVLGSVAGGVTGTTAVGNAVVSWDLIFK